MLQSLLTYGFLYSKSLDTDKSPAVLQQPLDEILEIPEAQALWGYEKKDEEDVEAEKNSKKKSEEVEEVEEEEEVSETENEEDEA